MSDERRPAHQRRGAEQTSFERDVRNDAIRYRRMRRAEARQSKFWGAYLALASAVIVATAFGIANAGHVLPGLDGGAHPAPVEVQEASSPADPGRPSGDAEGTGDSSKADSPRADAPGESDAPDAADGARDAQGAGRQPAASAQDGLDRRAADFAVDPARVDWNYETNGRKTVYLTIDDGPSENTQAVLDILDRYGCKATFFVVGHNDDYFPMIAEAFRRGHTIGLHSMTHDYAWVYSSTDAFYEDLAEIGEVVRDQIGFVPCFIRFPGGSSNMISADYTEGIMSELTGSVQEDGYQYYDWNLSVGDGAEHSTDEIVEYGMADEGDENIMLLCHDSATKQSTVEALPRIIEHYQSLGYSFEAIDRDSWVCHHGVSN